MSRIDAYLDSSGHGREVADVEPREQVDFEAAQATMQQLANAMVGYDRDLEAARGELRAAYAGQQTLVKRIQELEAQLNAAIMGQRALEAQLETAEYRRNHAEREQVRVAAERDDAEKLAEGINEEWFKTGQERDRLAAQLEAWRPVVEAARTVVDAEPETCFMLTVDGKAWCEFQDAVAALDGTGEGGQ